jgi:hypothetical protein
MGCEKMIKIKIECENNQIRLLCPFCTRRTDLLNDKCPHLLIRYNIIAGGYTYIRNDFEKNVDSDYDLDFETISFQDNDIVFHLTDDQIGSIEKLAIRPS